MTANNSDLDQQPMEHPVFAQPQSRPEPTSDYQEPSTPSEPSDTQDIAITTQQDLPPFAIAESQESTRSTIAWTFTIFYLTLIFLALITPFIINLAAPQTFANPIKDSQTLATGIASLLSGPFGFIVGFYFKQNDN